MAIPASLWYGVSLQRRQKQCEIPWKISTTATSHPTRRTWPPHSELKRATERVTRFENQLSEQLGEAGQTILAKLIESQQEIDSITAMENFILGFRLGVRMMTECLNDNDGDIRTGGE